MKRTPSSPKSTACRLCEGSTAFAFEKKLLRRIQVEYRRCTKCELIQTSRPTWLEEAYSAAISALDTGAVERNAQCRSLTSLIAKVLRVSQTDECLDYAGGHGIFARMMRDRGFNFFWTDKYADNLFAKGFEWSSTQ